MKEGSERNISSTHPLNTAHSRRDVITNPLRPLAALAKETRNQGKPLEIKVTVKSPYTLMYWETVDAVPRFKPSLDPRVKQITIGATQEELLAAYTGVVSNPELARSPDSTAELLAYDQQGHVLVSTWHPALAENGVIFQIAMTRMQLLTNAIRAKDTLPVMVTGAASGLYGASIMWEALTKRRYDRRQINYGLLLGPAMLQAALRATLSQITHIHAWQRSLEEWFPDIQIGHPLINTNHTPLMRDALNDLSKSFVPNVTHTEFFGTEIAKTVMERRSRANAAVAKLIEYILQQNPQTTAVWQENGIKQVDIRINTDPLTTDTQHWADKSWQTLENIINSDANTLFEQFERLLQAVDTQSDLKQLYEAYWDTITCIGFPMPLTTLPQGTAVISTGNHPKSPLEILWLVGIERYRNNQNKFTQQLLQRIYDRNTYFQQAVVTRIETLREEPPTPNKQKTPDIKPDTPFSDISKKYHEEISRIQEEYTTTGELPYPWVDIIKLFNIPPTPVPSGQAEQAPEKIIVGFINGVMVTSKAEQALIVQPH